MSHWFHRNPLKATAPVQFDLKLSVRNPGGVLLCNSIRQSRKALLELLSNSNNELSVVENAFKDYLSFLHGFIMAPNGEGASKLRYSLCFRWTQSCLDDKPVSQQDAVFEMISITQNMGIWLMKHASAIAGKDELSMDDALEVHNCLRKAAGLFSAVQDNYLGLLDQNRQPGSDLDAAVINAYFNQCVAEAREVTIARAVELKHAPSLISALANETSKLFTSASVSISNTTNKFAKWKKYLELKGFFYLAYAYCYTGENLLAQEKCGAAIKSLQESRESYSTVLKLVKEYEKIKTPGIGAKVDVHVCFRRFRTKMDRLLDKCERENGFIFHQSIPNQPVQLEMNASHAQISPQEFVLPPLNGLWTKEIYAIFDVAMHQPNSTSHLQTARQAEDHILPVKEAPIHQTKTDPKNESGCCIQ